MDQTIFNGYIDERFQGTIDAELAVAMIGSDGTSTLVEHPSVSACRHFRNSEQLPEP